MESGESEDSEISTEIQAPEQEKILPKSAKKKEKLPPKKVEIIEKKKEIPPKFSKFKALDAEKYEIKFGPLHTQLNLDPPSIFEQLDFETRVDQLASSMIAAPEMTQQICEHYGIKYSQKTGKLDRRTTLGKAIDNRMRDFQNS